MKTLSLAVAAALVVLCLSTTANAQSPAGGWVLQVSDHSGEPRAPVGVCLDPNGAWAARRDGFHWLGLWYYTGGPVRLLGNYGTLGHPDYDVSVVMEVNRIDAQSLAGTYTQWTGNLSSQTNVSWGHVVFKRDAEMCIDH